jgi:[protein-PII] uridylyltransferase
MNGLRAARDGLIADRTLAGAAFGRALADLVDMELATAAAELRSSTSWVLLALGSYARRELCPGSDIDVMLLQVGPGRRNARSQSDDASRLWYPLWDAGFVLGHSVRTLKEALDLADQDLDAMTALTEVRVVAGSSELADRLVADIRRLAPRRRGRLIAQLAAAARDRTRRPGPIAEMLEPNLKRGAGGLQDVQSAGWVGWALEPSLTAEPGWAGGVHTLVERGYLQAGDPVRLQTARARLLDARVALHRSTGGRSDQLTLQEQDSVARLVGAADADALVRTLGEAARAVTWTTSDLWARLLAAQEGPRSRASGFRDLGDGMTLRDGRLAFDVNQPIDATHVLALSARAAQLQCQFERGTLNRIAGLGEVEWTAEGRDAFIALLRTGRQAISVFETLDHFGVLVRLLPEWESVRARPQRNAYHRFTVDRHSLEAVAECVAILDAADPATENLDSDIARRARSDVLLLGALLHDIGKGLPGDHSEVGAETAHRVADRVLLDASGTDELIWLVRHHLLLADTATRRDVNNELTITRFARTVQTTERLDLLYALTLGDSRATGPAAWSSNKATLVRQLWTNTNALLSEGTLSSEPVSRHRAGLRELIGEAADEYLDAMPAAYVAAFSPETLAHHRDLVLDGRLAVEWAPGKDQVVCTVVASDHTGLLATVAGTLALVGLDISAASCYSHRIGVAIEVFSGVDRFGRLKAESDRALVRGMLVDALTGDLPLDERLAARTRRYRTNRAAGGARDVRVFVDLESSTFATVLEVHAPDDVGLLARVAAVFADLDLDVTQAIVSTLGDHVVDVFYLRDANAQKITDTLTLNRLRATVLARLTTAVTLDSAS